jgi:bifunctional DNA-binding transcriptional regulator/antitoxin component of YhaV-PrlF toxin-antitoxin module
MKTTLNADGNIGIPAEIRQTDHLTAGDSFELERLTPGHYLLTRQQPHASRFTVAIAEDGLPVIRTENGIITSRLVKDIDSQTP